MLNMLRLLRWPLKGVLNLRIENLKFIELKNVGSLHFYDNSKIFFELGFVGAFYISYAAGASVYSHWDLLTNCFILQFWSGHLQF